MGRNKSRQEDTAPDPEAPPEVVTGDPGDEQPQGPPEDPSTQNDDGETKIIRKQPEKVVVKRAVLRNVEKWDGVRPFVVKATKLHLGGSLKAFAGDTVRLTYDEFISNRQFLNED